MAKRKSPRQKQMLEKRLSAYSFAAASLLLGANKANSTIHYDGTSAVLMYDDDVFNVQFAGNTKFQIRFNKTTQKTYYPGSTFKSTSHSTPNTTGTGSHLTPGPGYWIPTTTTQTFTYLKVGVYPATGNASFVGSSAYASAMNGSATIGYSKSFSGAGSSRNMAFFSNRYFSARGNFRDTSDRYLGLRFNIGGDTHYGWVQVSIPSDVSSATITGLAYEDMAGVGILAGEEDTSLPVFLTAFSAAFKGGVVRLAWTTESETDHAGFILSRRALNRDGSPASPWTEIASYRTHDALRGSGNSSSRKDFAFVDVNVETGAVYEYILSDVDSGGKTTTKRLIRVETAAHVPSEFTLHPNYPNPFNPETTIRFNLPEDAAVQVSVYDVRGRKAAMLVDGRMEAGSHELKWNAAHQSSGTYFCEVRAGDQRKIIKLTLMR